MEQRPRETVGTRPGATEVELEKRWEIRESGANEQDLGTPWNVGAGGRRNQGLGQLGQDGALRQRNAKLGVFLGYLAKGADGTCGRERVSRLGVQLRDAAKTTRDSA